MCEGPASGLAFSVVIPVFNSAAIVGKTIDGVAAFFTPRGDAHEIIAVNDGSTDASWQVLERKASEYPQLTAVNLARNYGQRAATMYGLRASRGAHVCTMDDDLQHPPEALGALIARADNDHDLVFAVGRDRRAAHLRAASVLVTLLTRRLFGLPEGIEVSSFRLLRRDVVTRMLASDAASPYVTGLAIACARNPADVRIDHVPASNRPSHYTMLTRLRLLPAVFAGKAQTQQGRDLHEIAATEIIGPLAGSQAG